MNTIVSIFTITVSLVLPIILVIYMSLKKKGWLKPIFLGTMTFVIFQLLFRTPILLVVFPNMPWYIKMTSVQPILASIFLGFTASLFENGGRYLMMKLFMKDRHRFSDGFAFGLGHGGIEAIVLVGINSLLTLIIHTGTNHTFMTLMAGIERLSVIIVQIALSIMILKSIKQKKIIWFFIPLILHTLLDTSCVVLSTYNVTILVTEASIVIFALFMLAFIIKENKQQRRLLQ